MTVAEKLGDVAGVKARIRKLVEADSKATRFVVKILGREMQS